MTRLEGWLADQRVRLARSWGAFSHGNWARSRRLAERFWARRTRLAEGYWVRRYRFKHRFRRLQERFADRYWARRERRAGRAGRSPYGSEPRAPALVMASLFVVLTVAVGVTIRPLAETPDPTDAYSPAPIIDEAPGTDVPDVRGMSALEAGALLERTGLRFERATAALGTPGQVLGTLPSIGSSVSSGTPVTLIVGVEAERIASSNPPTPPFSSPQPLPTPQ